MQCGADLRCGSEYGDKLWCGLEPKILNIRILCKTLRICGSTAGLLILAGPLFVGVDCRSAADETVDPILTYMLTLKLDYCSTTIVILLLLRASPDDIGRQQASPARGTRQRLDIPVAVLI